MNSKSLETFKRLFWFFDRKAPIDPSDRNLITHQVLAYGGLDDIRKLIRLYGKKTVVREFKKPRAGLYQPAVLNFIQHLLGVKRVAKEKYVKNLYAASSRNIRSR
ncbi:MAG: hypothetical protein V1707_01490 [bacterium]